MSKHNIKYLLRRRNIWCRCTNLNQHLKVRRVCLLWVLHKFTAEQKDRYVKWRPEGLKKFELTVCDDMVTVTIITRNETYLYLLLRYSIGSQRKIKYGCVCVCLNITNVEWGDISSVAVNKKCIAVFFQWSRNWHNR